MQARVRMAPTKTCARDRIVGIPRWIIVLACAIGASCGADAPPSQTAGTARSEPPAASPASAVQSAVAPEDPCAWMAAEEVARIVGPVAGTPTRVLSAETPRPHPRGTGCQYTLTQPARLGKSTVAFEVVLNEGVIVEDVIGSMLGRFRRELQDGKASTAETAESAAPVDGWDYVARLPNIFIGRRGHIGVRTSAQTSDVSMETLARLASALRDRLPDRPFAVPPDPDLEALAALDKAPDRPASGRDPCSLVTRQEAEAVLGPLGAAPYRSAKDSPLVEPTGDSCSYYTSNHRALVITPEWNSGKMLFGMARQLGGLAGSVLDTPSREAETGPWDEMITDPTGALNFLKGDQLLKLDFRNSSTDREGAMKLGTLAVARLSSPVR